MKIEKNKTLKNLSTFCIGGNVEYFCVAKNENEIFEAVRFAEGKNIPWRVIGGGSNILFPNKKIKGLLIQIKGGIIKNNGNEISVFAGTPLNAVVSYSLKKGLCGLESLTAIPGSVGGAIYGNAGAYGRCIGQFVSFIEVFEDGKKKVISKKSCEFGYRDSIFKKRNWVITQIFLKLKKGDVSAASRIAKKINLERKKKYPSTLKCPGSFFKNPLLSEISVMAVKKIDPEKIIDGKIPAGYLLESVGAKGLQIGGIKIADYHGNLFINTGNATAADVYRISKILKNKVQRKFGITLHEEIQFL